VVNCKPSTPLTDGIASRVDIATNTTIDISVANTVSAVTCEVTVRRTTIFYMLNYIMVWTRSPHPSPRTAYNQTVVRICISAVFACLTAVCRNLRAVLIRM